MTKKCSQYTSEQISQFVDNELCEDLCQAIDHHQKDCQECQSLIQEYQTFSDQFTRHTDQQVNSIDSEQLNKNLAAILNRSSKKSSSPFGRLFGKNIYLKLASIVAILVVSLVGFQGRLIGPTGPSAIVESVDSESGSVMIFETEKQKHTIIWFSEA